MTYKIGDIFENDENYSDRVLWADKNGATVEDLGNGKFKLVEITQPSIDDLKAAKRAERDAILASTDKYMLPDYPITDEDHERYKQYRKYLRDISASADFPNVDILSFDDWNIDIVD